MSGYQVSGDAPTFYMRYSYAMQEPWTNDLILQARCKDGDRVLDVACGPGLVAGRVNQVSNATCKITGIDVNEAMITAAKKNLNIDCRCYEGDAPSSDTRRATFTQRMGA